MSETEPTNHEAALAAYLARAYDAHLKPGLAAGLEREVAAALPREMLEAKLKALQAVFARDYVSRVHHGFLRRVLALPRQVD